MTLGSTIDRYVDGSQAVRESDGCLDAMGPICKARGSADPKQHSVAGEGKSMTTFDKREEGFEKQFAHDEELRFKATARRNKMLGKWAAERLDLGGAEAEAYAKEVVMADFEEAGEEDVFRKIRADFDAKGVKLSDADVRQQMLELLALAVAEVKASG
jgi:hypothetical protein